MSKQFSLSLGMIVCAVCFVGSSILAADERSERQPRRGAAQEQPDALDEELLKSLSDDEADELGEVQGKNAKHGEEPGEEGTRPSELDEELLRGLGDGEDVGDENPLVKVGRQMRQVEELIGGEKAGAETQELQKQIVAELDKLLKQAQQQQQSQSSKSKNQDQQKNSKRRQVQQPQSRKEQQAKKSQNPAQQSTERLGPDKLLNPDKLAVSDLIKRVWGQLPEKEREQMSQHSVELFLPQYEQLITEYFKALVEKQKE